MTGRRASAVRPGLAAMPPAAPQRASRFRLAEGVSPNTRT
jgi:hypothetical protein